MHELKQFTTHEVKDKSRTSTSFHSNTWNLLSCYVLYRVRPFTKKKIFVEKDTLRKERQKEIVVAKKVFVKQSKTLSGMQVKN